MTDLKEHWLHALSSAAEAVDAATAARSLPAEEARARRNRLAAERTWVETVEWSTLDSKGGTVAVLAPRSTVSAPAAVERAA